MCMGKQQAERDHRLDIWFYVPDYPAVRERLEAAYKLFDVEEWSAEAGRVGGCPDDADISVVGTDANNAKFWNWLIESGIPGLMIEGKEIGPRYYPEGKPK